MLELEGVVGVGYTMRLSSRPDGCAVQTQTHCNGDDGGAYMFAEYCHVRAGRTGRTFVFIGVCVNSKVLLVFGTL